MLAKNCVDFVKFLIDEWFVDSFVEYEPVSKIRIEGEGLPVVAECENYCHSMKHWHAWLPVSSTCHLLNNRDSADPTLQTRMRLVSMSYLALRHAKFHEWAPHAMPCGFLSCVHTCRRRRGAGEGKNKSLSKWGVAL